jgi:60 kDa SS-A/Ro ribonucleoprotein
MKFNTKSTDTTLTVNYEGEKAFALDAAMELYTAVVTWSLNDTFYEKSNPRLLRVRALIAQNDPVFVAQLAVYTRHQMYLRSAPLVLITELAKIHAGDDLVARTTAAVVARADEITELLACYQLLNQRTGTKKLNRISKQIQKGLAAAFNRFDEYQFAKYNRDTEVKLRDVLFLVHPKAKDEQQQALFDKIATNTLATPYTWETELSALGQVGYPDEGAKKLAFKQKWEELIDSQKLGYMALLRNVRNLLEAEISHDHVQKVCQTLASAENVAKARQFPFRYLSAYRELQGNIPEEAQRRLTGTVKSTLSGSKVHREEILEALEAAILQSVATIPGFDPETRVLVACDVSGSMYKPVSPKSKVLLFDIGLVLAMLLQTRCQNVGVGMFGDTWKTIAVPKNDVLANVQEFYRREGEVGYSTNGYLVIQDLLERKQILDKVMIFTDCQLWNSTQGNEHIQALWQQYRREVAPEARLYLFDLSGYGKSPVRIMQEGVDLLAGWSDKVFGMLDALEKGKIALEEIRAIAI